jgi:predicted MFS family arabinose efflux permease
VPALAGLNFLTQLMLPIYNINQVSYRQAVIPAELQGRMNATVRTFIWGTLPLGALIGGILGTQIGLVPTIYVGGTISALAVLWILAGPIKIRQAPHPERT